MFLKKSLLVSSKCILERFRKDHVTLKTGIMIMKKQFTAINTIFTVFLQHICKGQSFRNKPKCLVIDI